MENKSEGAAMSEGGMGRYDADEVVGLGSTELS